MIKVSSQIVFSREEARMMAALNPNGGFGATLSMKAFLEKKGDEMVKQVQTNIVNLGQGGDWAPLSEDYEIRKSQGKTKGGAKFGSPAMLRDSGATIQAIKAEVKMTSGFTLSLLVPEILAYHMVGAGNLPVRNPVDAKYMKPFQDKFSQDLERFLTGKVS